MQASKPSSLTTQSHFCGTAGNADDAAALDLGDLADGLAHRTGGTGDDHGFAGLGLADIHQAEVAGHAGHAQHVEPLRHRAQARVDAVTRPVRLILVSRAPGSSPARRGRR